MELTKFITAEYSTSPFYGVWVMLRVFSVNLPDLGTVPNHFEVTTSTGYRAILPACRLDFAHDPCTRKLDDRHMHSGMSVDAWCKHIKTHCHGYHLINAEKFRDQVQETYVDYPRPR